MNGIGRAAACALALTFTASTNAQTLGDPTRPPVATDPMNFLAEGAPTARLQSVLLSSARKIAVIDGVAVPLGGKVGEARLVSILPTEVVLRQGGEDRVLKLHPAVDKKTKNMAASIRDRGGRQ